MRARTHHVHGHFPVQIEMACACVHELLTWRIWDGSEATVKVEACFSKVQRKRNKTLAHGRIENQLATSLLPTPKEDHIDKVASHATPQLLPSAKTAQSSPQCKTGIPGFTRPSSPSTFRPGRSGCDPRQSLLARPVPPTATRLSRTLSNETLQPRQVPSAGGFGVLC